MKPFTLVALATAVSGHAIFQRVSVNGVDQGQLKGVRAPYSNSPITDLNHADFACNTNIQLRDSTVIKVPAGARVGAWWQHEIGGPSGPSDPDNPIAASHKGASLALLLLIHQHTPFTARILTPRAGPISVYLAKVDNAASASPSGQKWFKIAERGLNNGVWAVDEMISNNGWHYFTMPSCIAPGQYLMRVELLALHNAYSAGGAQFYMECAQIEVTGSGTNTGSNFVSFPGAYPSNDPGIVLSIYDSSGKPTNGGRAYPVPGPDPITCSGGDNGGGTNPTPTTTTAQATPTNGGGGGSVPLYGQCGGQGYTGPTTCAQGTCKAQNNWYSQCLP
jgi:cellulase